MTRQLAAPIRHLSLTPTHRLAEDMYHQIKKGQILLDPPYQRGSVWTEDQRLDLMYSFLAGYPIGSLIINDRMHGPWNRDANYFKTCYAVIDGRQRLETVVAWFDGVLAFPASWIPADWYDATQVSEDDPWVTHDQFTAAGQRHVESRMAIPVVTAQVDTVQDEAEIYRLVNAGGTAQTPEDLARAARVAEH